MYGVSILIAVCLSVMVWCLLDAILFRDRPVFKKGSRRELDLIMAVRKYIADHYPALSCECEGEVSVAGEQRISKNRFRIVFDFMCHETCKANHERIAFIVDVQDTPVIVEPANPASIKKYAKVDFD